MRPIDVGVVGTVGLVLGLVWPRTAAALEVIPATETAPTSTSFGVVPGHVVDRVCKAERFFVGTITSRTSYWHTTPKYQDTMWSDVKLSVEADIMDTISGQTTQVSMIGGQIGDWTFMPAGSVPRPVVGYRYLLALASIPPSERPASTPPQADMMLLSIWLDPSQTLPPEAQLQQEFFSTCK